jgi:hypothetical protein
LAQVKEKGADAAWRQSRKPIEAKEKRKEQSASSYFPWQFANGSRFKLVYPSLFLAIGQWNLMGAEK